MHEPTDTDLSLPALFTTDAGGNAETRETWESKRRAEILELFRTHVYGRTPDRAATLRFEVLEEDPQALDGTAIRKQVLVEASAGDEKLAMRLLLYLPRSAAQTPVPVMLLLNFGGNHTVHPDPAIALATGWLRETFSPPESFRGARASRFPISEILARGYGLATAYYGDIDPDFDDGFENGAHRLLDPADGRTGDSWGSVGAWSWGLSRFMDYFETDRQIDQHRVVVLGHSRLGKAALWAGAQDERFAMVISNDSGCTGAAIARRRHGETVAAINKSFPHWFSRNYHGFAEREDELPVDQHMLLALIAPRPVYVASATEDHWADPPGEFLSCVHAGPVYELYGRGGLGTETMPDEHQPIQRGHIGYHLRAGKHDLTPYDWSCFMDYADKHLTNTQ